ncbi:hypothetical protein ABT408_35120, partial [Streptomyces halstedii]
MMETTGGEPDDGTAEVLDRPLPDGVRRRVVQIVSDGFGGLTLAELPTQLRQYKGAAPAGSLYMCLSFDDTPSWQTALTGVP